MKIRNSLLQSQVNRSITLQSPLSSPWQILICCVLASHSHNFMQRYVLSPMNSKPSSGNATFLFFVFHNSFSFWSKLVRMQQSKFHAVLLWSFQRYFKHWLNICSSFGDYKSVIPGGQQLITEHLLLSVWTTLICTEPWLVVHEIFPTHCLGSSALGHTVVRVTY